MAWATITYLKIICWAQIENGGYPQRYSNKEKTNVPVSIRTFFLFSGRLVGSSKIEGTLIEIPGWKKKKCAREKC